MKAELPIVAAIICVVALVFYPAIQRTRNPKGPPGEVYPSSAPSEANRLVHPTGLSMVAPENWDQVTDAGPEVPFLRIAARGAPGRRLRSVIMVSQFSLAPGEALLSQCTETTFQGALAFEVCKIVREDTFDDEASSTYDLYFERHGKWWHVNFLVADRMTRLPQSIRQYLDTIQLPSPE